MLYRSLDSLGMPVCAEARSPDSTGVGPVAGTAGGGQQGAGGLLKHEVVLRRKKGAVSYNELMGVTLVFCCCFFYTFPNFLLRQTLIVLLVHCTSYHIAINAMPYLNIMGHCWAKSPYDATKSYWRWMKVHLFMFIF